MRNLVWGTLCFVSSICFASGQEKEFKTFTNSFADDGRAAACAEAKNKAADWLSSVSRESVTEGIGKRGWAGKAGELKDCDCSSQKNALGREVFTCSVDASIVSR